MMEGPDALMRLRESQKAAARAGRRAKAASTCPLASTVKGVCRRGGRATPPVRYRRLLYRLVPGRHCSRGWPRIAQVRPAGRLWAGLEACYGWDTLVKRYFKL